jgi:HAD superfamily phosphoserine phosphatase-like hydrolase
VRAPPIEKMLQLKDAIRLGLAEGAAPIAAFDADGTLWGTDVGENFFQFQIDRQLVPLPEDPWAAYEGMKEKSHPEAYLWLAQILKGRPLKEVRDWAREAVASYPGGLPVFPWMRDLITFLREAGVEIYVVTASITWAVEPAAALLGIPADRVVGVETAVENGLVTANQHGPITWREGKVEGLLQRTQGRRPFFAAGNTMGDFQLIECATHIHVVNATVARGHENYATEQELARLGGERNWHVLQT